MSLLIIPFQAPKATRTSCPSYVHQRTASRTQLSRITMASRRVSICRNGKAEVISEPKDEGFRIGITGKRVSTPFYMSLSCSKFYSVQSSFNTAFLMAVQTTCAFLHVLCHSLANLHDTLSTKLQSARPPFCFVTFPSFAGVFLAP